MSSIWCSKVVARTVPLIIVSTAYLLTNGEYTAVHKSSKAWCRSKTLAKTDEVETRGRREQGLLNKRELRRARPNVRQAEQLL